MAAERTDKITELLIYVSQNIEKVDLEDIDKDIPNINADAVFNLSESGAIFYRIRQMCMAISDQIDIILRPDIIPIYNDTLIRQKMGINEKCQRVAMTRYMIIFSALNIGDNCALIDEIYEKSKEYEFPVEWQVLKYVPHNNFVDYYLYLGEEVIAHTLGSFQIKKKQDGKINIHFAFKMNADAKEIYLMLINYLNMIIGEYNFIKLIKHIKLKQHEADFLPLKNFPEEIFKHIDDMSAKCAMCFLRDYNCTITKSDMTDDVYCDFCKRGVENFLCSWVLRTHKRFFNSLVKNIGMNIDAF